MRRPLRFRHRTRQPATPTAAAETATTSDQTPADAAPANVSGSAEVGTPTNDDATDGAAANLTVNGSAEGDATADERHLTGGATAAGAGAGGDDVAGPDGSGSSDLDVLTWIKTVLLSEEGDGARVDEATVGGRSASTDDAAEAAGEAGHDKDAGTRGRRRGWARGWRDRRCRRHRWLRAGLVAGALALPGSMLAEAAGMLPGADRSSPVAQLGGTLPTPDQQDEPDDPALEPFLDEELLEAVPVGDGEVAEPVEMVLASSQVVDTLGQSGIPEVALDAYMQAADRLADDDPSCGIRWTLLAAIGRVESNHGRFGGAQLRDDGYGTRPIRGIPLDGRPNVAVIRDTDGGELDGDTTYDRAVGPIQFIPSTWRSVGVDADGDGRSDPNNIFDAAQGAAVYLCAGGGDLRSRDGQAPAVRRYNNADEYVRVVLNLVPGAPESPDTAAVGWAPAMREVVVGILETTPPEALCPAGDPAATTTSTAPAGPGTPPPPPCPPAPPSVRETEGT